MIGIYLITNLINNKKYVGQSIDIERRYQEHLRSGQPEKYSHKNGRDLNTPIHKAIQKYGIQNFSLQVLENCDKENLDEKEKYWIKYYKSNQTEYGYNLTEGGQKRVGLKGERHSQAKLTQAQVDEIKRLLKYTDKNLNEILGLFPFISKSTLSMINQGKVWFDENETYPIRKMSTANKGSANGNSKLTEEQVMDIRKAYSEGTPPCILSEKYKDIVSSATISAILRGKIHKHLPIWNNTLKQWIEPCIDHSQSLKQAGK